MRLVSFWFSACGLEPEDSRDEARGWPGIYWGFAGRMGYCGELSPSCLEL